MVAKRLQKGMKRIVSTNRKEEMMNFYKVIYSERSIQPMAARILAEETSKMLHFKMQI